MIRPLFIFLTGVYSALALAGGTGTPAKDLPYYDETGRDLISEMIYEPLKPFIGNKKDRDQFAISSRKSFLNDNALLSVP